MSHATELEGAVAELNKKLEELGVALRGYKGFVSKASKSMDESIGIFLDKTQTVIEMAYRKNANPESLEKISNEILTEINKLLLLKGELHKLSNIENEDDSSFPRLSKEGAKDQGSSMPA